MSRLPLLWAESLALISFKEANSAIEHSYYISQRVVVYLIEIMASRITHKGDKRASKDIEELNSKAETDTEAKWPIQKVQV
jgi:hypothetical protein